jgi:hypothetical protein
VGNPAFGGGGGMPKGGSAGREFIARKETAPAQESIEDCGCAQVANSDLLEGGTN